MPGWPPSWASRCTPPRSCAIHVSGNPQVEVHAAGYLFFDAAHAGVAIKEKLLTLKL